MIKINISKEEVVTPKPFSSVRWRVELEDYADNEGFEAKLKKMQETINAHIEEEKSKVVYIEGKGR